MFDLVKGAIFEWGGRVFVVDENLEIHRDFYVPNDKANPWDIFQMDPHEEMPMEGSVLVEDADHLVASGEVKVLHRGSTMTLVRVFGFPGAIWPVDGWTEQDMRDHWGLGPYKPLEEDSLPPDNTACATLWS